MERSPNHAQSVRANSEVENKESEKSIVTFKRRVNDSLSSVLSVEMAVNKYSLIEGLAKQEDKIIDAQDRFKKIEHETKKMMFTSQMMQTLMLDLLDLAQMESCSLKINNDYFNLIEIIDQSFLMLCHVFDMKKITLEKKFDEDKE